MAQRESAVAGRVEDLGFEVFAPKAKMNVNGSLTVRALFPGYFFTMIELQFYEIKWCIGVIRLIMNGDQPARVPDFEIDKIQRATGDNGLVRLPKKPRVPPRTKITVGDEVRIITGHFRGLHALYQGSTPEECERVLLDLFGRQTPVELAPDDRVHAVPDEDRKILPFTPRVQ
jgi:transcriptional antiterminator RfaH